MKALSISVVVPTFNAGTLIETALKSALDQSRPPLEVIVVDDGSTDVTPQILKEWEPQIRVLRQANRGPAAARNVGVQASHGSCLAFLDADDYWDPNHLQSLGQALLDNNGTGIALSQLQQVSPHSSPDRPQPLAEPTGALHLGSALIHRSTWDAVGPLDESLSGSEDVDWFLRARESGENLLQVSHTGLFYRSHLGSLTQGVSTEALGLHRCLKRSLDRRRNERNRAYSLPPLKKGDPQP